MTDTRKRAAWATLAIAATAVTAAPAAAHDVTVDVSCERARFVYTDNARGQQTATETVTADGVELYRAPRVWTTTGRIDTFDVPLTIHGARTIAATVTFIGSDGYRYTRTVTRSVQCAELPPPPPPPVEEPPRPPVSTTPQPPPADPPTTTPPPKPPAPPETRKPPLPRPTVCKRFSRKPGHAVTRGVPRPGQIRVRFVPGRGWYGFRGDRFARVKISGRTVVVFVPGEFCGPVLPKVTG